MKPIRAFFCLPLPEPLLNDLALWLREADMKFRENRVTGARFVPRFNLHVTLRFCGEISEQTATALDRRLAAPVREALAAMPELSSVLIRTSQSENSSLRRPVFSLSVSRKRVISCSSGVTSSKIRSQRSSLMRLASGCMR